MELWASFAPDKMDLHLAQLKRVYLYVFFVYLAMALLMFWNVTLNMTSKVFSTGGDVYQSMWGLWWVPYSIFTLHQQPFHSSMLYYPVGAGLVTQTLSPLAGILSWPLQQISMAFAYNTLFMLSFPLAGLFMFMLAYYFIREKYSAFIAGLIYAFSPIHVTQAYSHLNWAMIEFIPLFILLFIVTLREKKVKYAFAAACSFVLLTFVGDIEQGIIMAFFAVISLVAFLLLDRKGFISRKSFVSLGLFALFVLLLGAPFFFYILHGITSKTLATTNALSDIGHNMLYSDPLLSFLLPGYYNGIFHPSSTVYSGMYGLSYKGISYTPDIAERVSYIGYTVIALSLFALYEEYKRKTLKGMAAYWIAIAVIFFLLSLGPYIQLYNTSTGIPSLYLIYRKIPLFNIVREPGRFDFVLEAVLALSAALGFKRLCELRGQNGNVLKYAALVSLLILIEYNGMPLSLGFGNSLMRSAHVPKAYGEIGRLPGNFSVLILPALPNAGEMPALYTGRSMYYQTALKKPIIGGYTSRVNQTQMLSVESVPLTEAALYLESGTGLVYPSPLNENYTNVTLFWLYQYRTSFISVMNDAYTGSQLSLLLGYLESVFGAPIYESNSTTLFSTNAKIVSSVGKSIVAYAVGAWIPGFEFCTSTYCNETLASAWWGGNQRAINIFSPLSTRAVLRMQALSSYPNTLYVFVDQAPPAALNMTENLAWYSVELNLSQGLNQIVLYGRNSTFSQNQYLNFGVENISIKAV